MPNKGAAAVVLAAGSGTRMQADRNKAYLSVAGRPVVAWSLGWLAEVDEVVRTLLVIRPEDRAEAEELIESELPGVGVEVVDGGATRHQSEHRALEYLAPDIDAGLVDVVLLHDGARPLAGPDMMRTAVAVARSYGGAVPGVVAADLVATDDEGRLGPLQRSERHIRVQTPQAFRAQPLLAAYRRAAAERFEGTDTSASVEQFTDVEVRYFPGDPRNLKVTYAPDLFLAERLLTDW